MRAIGVNRERESERSLEYLNEEIIEIALEGANNSRTTQMPAGSVENNELGSGESGNRTTIVGGKQLFRPTHLPTDLLPTQPLSIGRIVLPNNYNQLTPTIQPSSALINPNNPNNPRTTVEFGYERNMIHILRNNGLLISSLQADIHDNVDDPTVIQVNNIVKLKCKNSKRKYKLALRLLKLLMIICTLFSIIDFIALVIGILHIAFNATDILPFLPWFMLEIFLHILFIVLTMKTVHNSRQIDAVDRMKKWSKLQLIPLVFLIFILLIILLFKSLSEMSRDMQKLVKKEECVNSEDCYLNVVIFLVLFLLLVRILLLLAQNIILICVWKTLEMYHIHKLEKKNLCTQYKMEIIDHPKVPLAGPYLV